MSTEAEAEWPAVFWRKIDMSFFNMTEDETASMTTFHQKLQDDNISRASLDDPLTELRFLRARIENKKCNIVASMKMWKDSVEWRDDPFGRQVAADFDDYLKPDILFASC